jgi:hypothetical protein
VKRITRQEARKLAIKIMEDAEQDRRDMLPLHDELREEEIDNLRARIRELEAAIQKMNVERGKIDRHLERTEAERDAAIAVAVELWWEDPPQMSPPTATWVEVRKRVAARLQQKEGK